MKQLLHLTAFILLLLLSPRVVAQPLPCPPIVTTFLDGYGDTTICDGECTTIGCTYSTSIKSTSSYVYSTIPYLPTSYTGGTSVLVGIDDTWSNAVPLPFPFCFYGVKYNQCWIGANGQVSFTAQVPLTSGSDPWPINGPWPTYSGDAVGVKNCIMGAYYDIDPSEGGTTSWAIYGTAPCRTFVVSWSNVPLFTTGICPGQFGTQQIVLYESTYAIDIFIHTKPACTDWNNGFAILGIADATGTNYVLPAAYNGTVWSVTDAGFRFTPNGPPTWDFTWTDNAGAVISTSPTLVVCPHDSTTYHVKGVVSTLCNDSFKVYSSVFVDVRNPKVTHTAFTNPTLCSTNDGTITLYGLVPGLSDTIYYHFDGVLQPGVVQVSALDSSLKLTNLCKGTYDSIVVKVGKCFTDPVGPIILTAPPLTIGGATITKDSICGACLGTLTLFGLLPSQSYVLYYNFNGVPQPPAPITTTAGGTYTLINLCDSIYDNIYLSLPGPCTNVTYPCITPVIGPYKIVSPPADTLYLISFKTPTQCGFPDGSITIKAVTPFSGDTIFYTFNGVPQPPIITVAGADSIIHLFGLVAGTYADFFVKVGFCESPVIGSAVLTDSPLHAVFTDAVHYGCNGDSVIFANSSYTTPAGGILYYLWHFGDGTTDTTTDPAHIYAQGTYTVTLNITNHYCNDSTNLSFSLIHPLHAGFVATPLLLCQDSPVQFTDTSIGSSLSHQWYFGNGATDTGITATYNYLQTGVYTAQLVITDWVPCRDTASVVITVDTISGINMPLTDTVLCAGTYVTFTGLYADIGNTGVSWVFGDGDSIRNVNPVYHAYNDPGVFTATVVAHYRACKDTGITRRITVVPQPGIDLGRDTSICIGSESIILTDSRNAGNPAAHWLWNTGETGSSITVVAPGYYFTTVNVNNCYASDTVWVSNDCYMDIPNVFSPNGDGVNDYFYPRQYLTKGLISFKMNIYNRWGQLIFETTSLDGRGWDGKLNNTDQPEGVFVYIIDAKFKDGQKEHHQGNVTLLR